MGIMGVVRRVRVMVMVKVRVRVRVRLGSGSGLGLGARALRVRPTAGPWESWGWYEGLGLRSWLRLGLIRVRVKG